QQRTNDSVVNFVLKTSSQSCTPNEINQKSFYIVIQMMSRRQVGITVFFFQFVKPIVPQFSGSQLYGQVILPGIIFRIKMRQMQWQIILPGEVFHKLLVFVAFFSSQLEIDMCHSNIKIQFLKYMCQYHAIHTAAYGDKHRAIFEVTVIFCNVKIHFNEKTNWSKIHK